MHTRTCEGWPGSQGIDSYLLRSAWNRTDMLACNMFSSVVTEELSASFPYFKWYEPTLTQVFHFYSKREITLPAHIIQSPNYHAMNVNTPTLWQVSHSLISHTRTRYLLYPFTNQQRPTDCSISNSTGNMKAETCFTNVSLPTSKLACSFAGSINADCSRTLIYKVIKLKLDAKQTTPTVFGVQTKWWWGQQSLVLWQVSPCDLHALTDINDVNATITAR